MVQQNSWSSTPNAGAATVQDAFQRNLLMRYGGRTDSIWDYQDFAGYKRELGSANTAPNASFTTTYNSGSVDIPNYSRGGGTPSNPGGYNWNTFGNVVRGVGQGLGEAYNFLAERREVNKGELDYTNPSKSTPGFRVGNTPIYNTYRGKQQQIGQQQRIQNIQAARQQRQQLGNFASQTISTSKSLAAGVQAAKKPLKPGASSPMPRGGTPKPGPINLLTGPTALGQPTKKPRSARGTVQTPKAKRPSISTYDPSIW